MAIASLLASRLHLHYSDAFAHYSTLSDLSETAVWPCHPSVQNLPLASTIFGIKSKVVTRPTSPTWFCQVHFFYYIRYSLSSCHSSPPTWTSGCVSYTPGTIAPRALNKKSAVWNALLPSIPMVPSSSSFSGLPKSYLIRKQIIKVFINFRNHF